VRAGAHKAVEIGLDGVYRAQGGFRCLAVAQFGLVGHVREQLFGFRREQGKAAQIDDLQGAIDLVQMGGGVPERRGVAAIPVGQGLFRGLQRAVQFRLDPGERPQVEFHLCAHAANPLAYVLRA